MNTSKSRLRELWTPALCRRSCWALVAAGLAACAGPIAEQKALFTISADGQTLTIDGAAWTAPEGVSFFSRGTELHVISLEAGASFDVAVPLQSAAPLVWPKNPYFEAASGRLRVKMSVSSEALTSLLATGQVLVHNDHFHLTKGYQNDDWQLLYRLRAEDSDRTEVERKTLAYLIAKLLEVRIPGGSKEEALASMKRLDEIISRIRRGFFANMTPAQLGSVADHNYEISDDGRRLTIESQVFLTHGEVRFAYCCEHFHVEDAQGKWGQVIEFPDGGMGDRFIFPDSIFFAVCEDGTLVEKQTPTRWRSLMKSDQLRMRNGHWHLSEKYANKDLARIQQAGNDNNLSPAVRNDAQGRLLSVLTLRLGMGSDRELDESLEVADRAIANTWQEFKEKWKAEPAGHRPK